MRVTSDGPGVRLDAGLGAWSSAHPVGLLWFAPGSDEPHRLAAGYATVLAEPAGAAWTGTARLAVGPRCAVEVSDTWAEAGDEVRLTRRVTVRGELPGGFATRVGVVREAGRPGAWRWPELEVFAPGLVYGDAEPMSDWTLGGPVCRRSVRDVLVREDRLSAPHLTVRYPDGVALTVSRVGGAPTTVAADGLDETGGVLVDRRLGVAALGGFEQAPGVGEEPTGVAVGGCYPAVEGDWTYTSGGLPLVGATRRRATVHPLADGLAHTVTYALHASAPASRIALLTDVRERAWAACRPRVRPVPSSDWLAPVTRVLASQVRRGAAGRVGIGLESDATTGRPVPGQDAAVMGFVGANSDAGHCLLRARDLGLAGDEADRVAGLGAAVLDTFAGLEFPAGEGFDLRTGEPTTYRRLDGRPAVYLRAVAEGCLAAVRAAAVPTAAVPTADGGAAHGAAWSAWARRGAGFLLGEQRPDGSLPRCWEAGTGRVLSASGTATASCVELFLALSAGDDELRWAARAAGESTWRRVAERLAYAGGTLDNPDVVDKEGAILAARAFLALHRAGEGDAWLDRAAHAARVAESWVHLVDLPMPADVPAAVLHWKPGRSVVGLQLITSGVTMSDGFLAVDAAVYAELALRTGEAWPARVARLVHHGSKAMLATAAEPLDLAGPGWQQEHWGFGPRRGFGLNRHWLPWAAVAALDGYLRLRDLGPAALDLVAVDGEQPVLRG